VGARWDKGISFGIVPLAIGQAFQPDNVDGKDQQHFRQAGKPDLLEAA
jgi:hypothetical protein